METTYTKNNLHERRLPRVLLTQLPLWLFTATVSIEGFPPPGLPLWAGITAFALGVLIILYLAWRRALDASMFAMMLPFVLMVFFDEVTTSYKTPFLLVSTAVVSASILFYQKAEDRKWRALILLAGVIVAILLASHAKDVFWSLFSDRYIHCFPDCLPVSGVDTPWWKLFFNP